MKLEIDAPDSVAEQEIAILNTKPGDAAYHIGSPRDFWFSEGGWWVVGVKFQNDGSPLSIGGGGMSGGSIYNLQSDIVGVTATKWGDGLNVVSVLTDRQDPHETAYNPTINTNKSYVGSSDFFYLKRFISEVSPTSVNEGTNDYFCADTITFQGGVYEFGWHTAGGRNQGYIRKYVDAALDTTFASGGRFDIGFNGGNVVIKSVVPVGDRLYFAGSVFNGQDQDVFVARLWTHRTRIQHRADLQLDGGAMHGDHHDPSGER